jgi:beta-glucanase (GH16 family)
MTKWGVLLQSTGGGAKGQRKEGIKLRGMLSKTRKACYGVSMEIAATRLRDKFYFCYEKLPGTASPKSDYICEQFRRNTTYAVHSLPLWPCFEILPFVFVDKILSRVYSSVTSNNAVWIGWLDLLTPSFTIILNHDQLQEFTVSDSLRLASFSLDYNCLLF